MVLIFPLRDKLKQRLFLQQRPKYTGGRRIPVLPTLPWDYSDKSIDSGRVDLPPTVASALPYNFGLCALRVPQILATDKRLPQDSSLNDLRLTPAVVHALKVLPAVFFTISGVTRDSNSAILGNCTLDLFRTSTDVLVERTTSDANGYYCFKGPARNTTHYVVAYKAGSPDVAGTTVSTLIGE